MSSIYDRTDIYDLLEDQTHWSAYKKHWKTLLQGKNVHSFLDVSIGSGSVTLPLCELGVQLAGSDLSEEMIRKCKEKASAAGYEIELKSCDFRKLSCWEGKQFDCVASTGNSLPHVNNDDVLTALEQMNSLVKKGGYLYLDTRNWEKILNEKRRFYLYNPVFAKKCRVNLVQVWDYSSEDTITFNLLYTLLIISLIKTVFPTPAPPRSPILNPFCNGAKKSNALIPVHNGSLLILISLKDNFLFN